jgi:hypothetical protein
MPFINIQIEIILISTSYDFRDYLNCHYFFREDGGEVEALRRMDDGGLDLERINNANKEKKIELIPLR